MKGRQGMDKTKHERGAGSVPKKHWEHVVEAVLFSMGQSVELRQLAAAIGESEETAALVTENLKKKYDRDNG